MQEKRVAVVDNAGVLAAVLAASGANDIPVEAREIKPKPLTEADITYDKNGRRLLTKVYQAEVGSYLCNPANIVKRKLSGRQRKRMFKQSYRLKKMEKAIEESGKYVKDKAIEC